MRHLRFFFIASIVFLIVGGGSLRFPTLVFAGRTCCESPGNDPSKCNGCDSGIYWKNFGDNCGGDPSCRTCSSDHPVGNACGGGGGGPAFTCTIIATPANGTVYSIGSTVRSRVTFSGVQGLLTQIQAVSSDLSIISYRGRIVAPQGKFLSTTDPYYPGPGGTALASGSAIIRIYAYGKRCPACAEELACSKAIPVSVGATPSPTPKPTPTPTPTPSPTPTPLVSISSIVETDPSLQGGIPPTLTGLLDPYCASPSKGVGYRAGSIQATDPSGKAYKGSIVASGTYTIGNLPEQNDAYCIKFTPSDPKITCTCPVGCTYCGKDAPTTQDLKFYVSPIGVAWYQTIGGDVAAQNTSGNGLIDRITTNCVEPGCLPYLSLPFLSDLKTVGALITHKGGTVDLSDAPNNQSSNVSPGGSSRLARLDTPLVCRENYDYFYRLYSMGLAPTGDFPYPLDARMPDKKPDNDKLAYYFEGSKLTISQPWELKGGNNPDSIVVFVKGSLHIANTITVPPKAFLAFIVSGDITIDPSVGTTNHASTTPGQVQGIFIANNSIQVKGVGAGGEDKKFLGEGTFAACGGIKIDRDFNNGGAGLDNNRYPAALFTYRPDFMASTPERMKTATQVWQEVNP